MNFISGTHSASQRWTSVVRKPGWAALVFGVITFVISSFRASLNPDTAFHMMHPKRLVLVAAGAVLFWLIIRAREGHRIEPRPLARLAMRALGGIALLFVAAVAWDLLVTRDLENVIARNLRWILLWSGYFGTGFAAWLALQYQQALRQEKPGDLKRQPPPAAQSMEVEGSGFWVKSGRHTVHLARDGIEWIEAEGNYARIHGDDAAHGLVRLSLAAIEAQLEGGDFIRVHRSAICRRSAICGYRRKPSGAMLAKLASGSEVPVSRSFAKILTEQSRNQSSSRDDTVSRARSTEHSA